MTLFLVNHVATVLRRCKTAYNLSSLLSDLSLRISNIKRKYKTIYFNREIKSTITLSSISDKNGIVRWREKCNSCIRFSYTILSHILLLEQSWQHVQKRNDWMLQTCSLWWVHFNGGRRMRKAAELSNTIDETPHIVIVIFPCTVKWIPYFYLSCS